MSVSQEVSPPAASLPTRSRWDVIVVGCGVMGAAVSYNLARKGLRVLDIERFGVNHDHGSSHGRTRIIRLAYYEDPRYVPLLRRAFDSWREIESRSGKNLMRLTGGLMIGRPEGALVTGVMRTVNAYGLPHQLLGASEVKARFDAFSPGEEFSGVYEPNAGVLFSEDCVRAFVGLGSEAGCEFRFAEEVKSWTRRPDGLEVETSLGRQSTSSLVFCAGAWNDGLLQGLIPLQCERQVPLWFPSEGKERFSPTKMPIFIMEEEKDAFYYGIPDFGTGVKVARTHGGEVDEPDKVRRSVTPEDIAPVSGFVSRRLNDLTTTPISSTTCLYANTPDLNFVLGRHPTEPNVTIVSACSGHGFKFAGVIGEIVGGMVAGEKADYDLSFLSPERFQTTKK